MQDLAPDTTDRWSTPTDAAPSGVARPWSGATTVTLGMPQLDGCGLSETWLQKTCGAAHWRGLEAHLGRPAQDWRDASGRRVYAAFGIVRLRAARLAKAVEGERLRIASTLAAVGRSQAWSRHRLSTRGERIGELEMLSVFIGRGDDGSNRSVRRVSMRDEAAAEPTGARAVADHARAWRASLAQPVPAAEPYRTVRWLACPRNDFNGAGLVYFCHFTAWADRALSGWHLLGAGQRVVERECLFLGNLDPGEEVELALRADQPTATGGCLEVGIRCTRHDRLLAVVRTTWELA
ncbi:Pnap_2097 family protein [Xylophilus sp. GOD-11R]|uniref:Pnap_2097 family protein n=1 Tax=Xylophilus sp. GOD-11R TaxID=3089814 RepID=UPI00298C021A|nr:Pnap_2097 family protein [Xylophilus sp. GOD-11R]WPB55609.1 hypothetical protein R9X41_15850 [Xylophilus sp. GOD-11R]